MAMDGKKPYLGLGIALVFLISVLVIAPTGTAQSVCPQGPVQSYLTVTPGSIKPDSGGAAIRPITGSGEFSVDVDMNWDSAAVTVSSVTLSYEVSTQSNWIKPILKKTSAVKSIDPQGTTVSDSFGGTVFLTKDAPAFEPGEITIKVTATGGTCMLEPKPVTEKLPLKAGFYGKMQARLDKTIEQTGQNSKVTLPLIIENFGNGEIVTDFELIDREKNKVDVILPSKIIVPTAIGSTLDPKQIINIDIQTPYKNGYMNDVEQIQIKITSTSNDDDSMVGPEATVSALVRTQGVYVPGFELTTMLVAGLAALAGLVRRR